jgi:uncharacterized RDD family membrane protein YckC
MAPISGWYDDPRNPAGIRYWDGAGWTEHTAIRQGDDAAAQPGTAQPGTAQAGTPQPPARDWNYGTPGPPVWPYAQPTEAPDAPPASAGPPSAAQQQATAPPFTGHQPAGQQPTGWSAADPAVSARRRFLTPDGRQLASWGQRLGARLIDMIVMFFLSLPVTGYFFWQYATAIQDQQTAGTYSFVPHGNAVQWEMLWGLTQFVVLFCYETFCVRRWGATIGKRLVGISVRSWDRPGPVSWATAARRAGVIYALEILGLVPVVGVLFSVALLVSFLWPLWDARRQGLHDKPAGTVVVAGPRDDIHGAAGRYGQVSP